ncbi:MAG: NAD(P)-binding domain-containing protein [Rhodobacteraceae bacterium]|nr:NAD(P)-binding domain-containing protein [Paracoccaceae bacterium]
MQDRAAIVGAGPAGLTQARVLAGLGVPFTIFERAGDFGGLWNHEDPQSPIYDSAHLISSRTMTGFADYPMPESWADYPARDLILDYLRGFAQDYRLAEHTRFNEGVAQAEPVDGGWRLTTSQGKVEDFRWLIAANGSNRKPLLPHWPGDFTGTLRHAASYRNANELSGKRVLIVGLGNSGVDIACDATRTAKRVAVSLRRGYHIIPKHILGKPADVFAADSPPMPIWLRQRIFQLLLRIIVGDLSKYGMPKPDHRLMETHPLLNDQFIHHLRHGDVEILGDIKAFDGADVVFRDGHREAFDEVIAATGYDWEIPYIAENLLDWDRGRLAPPLSIFPEPANLFLLSFIESNGSSFSLFNEMAWVIGRAVLAERDNPGDYRKLRRLLHETSFDVTGGLHMQGTDRHVGYLDNKTYRKALLRLKRLMGWPKVETPPVPAEG